MKKGFFFLNILLLNIICLYANETSGLFYSKIIPKSIVLRSTSNDVFDFNKDSLLLESKKKSNAIDYYPQEYRVDIGFNNSYLLSSNILKKGYSGFGFFIEPYITKYFSFKFEFDRWIISSLKNDPHDTPFKIAHVWKKNYLVKINMYPWNQLIFTQFGIVGTTSKIGSEKRGGVNFGIGYRLINYKNINVFLTAKRNIFGQPSIGGSEIWDINSELSIDVIYKIKWKSN